MRHATHHMEPNVHHDDEPPRTSREDKKDEEQVRRSCGIIISIYRVDPKSQIHMTSHAPQK